MSETAPLSLGSQLGRLGRHSLIYGIGGLVSRIVAVLLLPLYTHYLTPADYGKIETLIALTTVLGIILRAGISSAFFRFYFDAEGDVARRTVLRTSFWFTMGAGTLGLLLLLVFAEPVSDFLFGTTNAANLVRAAGVALWASVNYEQLTSLFRVEERSVAFVCASLANVFITIGLTLVLVVSLDKGAIGVIVGNFSGTLIVYFALLGFRREQLGLQFDRGLLREMNRFGIPLVPTALFLWITNFSDRFFLVKLSDVSEAGLYSVGVRVASAMVLLLTAFRMAWPAFAYSIRDEDEAKRTYAYVLTYLTVVTAWVALALTLFAPWLVDLLATPRFAESYRVVGPLSFAAVAFAAYIVVAIGVGRIRRTQFNWVVTGAAAIVNVALNLALIPPYGMIGAAIATVAAYVTMAVGMAWWSQRIYPVPYQWRRVVTAAAAAVGLAVLGKGLDVGFGAAFALCLAYPLALAVLGFTSPEERRRLRAARHALEQCLLEQEDVQADDHRRDRGRHDRRRPPVDERAHQLAVAAEPEQRDQRERDPERERDLAQHQRARGVDPRGDDDQRRRHRDRPPEEERDPAPDEALHHDLPGERADARRREPRREERDPEEEVRVPAELRLELVGDLHEVVADVRQALLVEDRGGDDQHAHVDDACDPHRDHHVDELEPVDAALLLLRRSDDAVLRQRGVEVDHVRHHGRTKDPDCEQHALGALEARDEAAGDLVPDRDRQGTPALRTRRR